MTNHLRTILLAQFLIFSSVQELKKTAGNPPELPGLSSDSLSILRELSISPENVRTRSGIYTLENGGLSLVSRLWLFSHAKKSIDIQYYSFAKDVTGRLACDYLIRAADNGVMVRILIDDAASRMRSYEIKLLDSHKNIEIRVYNAGLMLGRLDRRIYQLAGNSNRLLRRMHNKTLTIDDQICIMGGRNIADEYFDYDQKYNFRDRDVLLIGNPVKEVKSSFEKFWNDDLTVPYSELSGKNRKEIKNDPDRFDRLHNNASKDLSPEMEHKISVFPQTISSAQKSGELVWVSQASFVSDIPGKNEDREKREGGVCMDSLINLFRSAKNSVDIQSPYFITTEVGKQLIQELTQRGIKIRLLTNSLASTDNYEAFSGYQRDREKILKTGVQIFEFKPDAQVRYKLMIPEVQAKLNYKSVYGLHSKTIVIDKFITIIGSLNFDPRSTNYNTECISIIRSADVAKNVLRYIEEEFLPENSWPITIDFNADSKAGIKKRAKAASRRVIPKKVL
jgi:putative cardiolipin synthase